MLTHAVALVITLLLPQAPNERPQAAEQLTGKADVDRVHGRFDEAIATYRQALAIDPAYLRARRGLGQIFDLLGRYADARAEYLAGLEGKRQSYEAAPLLWSLAVSYVFDRHFDEAHTALQGWADLVFERRGDDPNDSLAFFDLAMAGDAFDEAERMLDQHYGPIAKPPAMVPLPALDPHVVMTQLSWMRYNAQRAVISARRERADEARQFMAEAEAQAKHIDETLATFAATTGTAVSLSSRRELMLPESEVAFWLGDTGGAIRLLAGGEVMSPRHNLLLGRAYEREHDLRNARAAYSRVIESTVVVSIELAWARPISQERLAAIGR